MNGIRIREATTLRLSDVIHIGGVGFRVVSEIEYEPSRGARTLAEATGRVQSVVELFRIVHEDRTWTAFQPVVDLGSREVLGWEALGRPVLAAVGGPSTLLKLAEQSNAAGALSGAFRKSTRLCATCRHCWPNQPRALLFLNFHPDEILVPGFPDLLLRLADSDLLRWYQPVLELPESLVCNTRDLATWVQEIRRCGLLVAYDDFGRGQSRIPDLVQAPPDVLKLDRELVVDLGRRTVKDDLVQAIVKGCERLGGRVIAEGIETREELDACIEMGIHCGQGFYLGRPLPAWKLFDADPTGLPPHCPFVRYELLPKTPAPELPRPALRR